jgi:hypothetical protein
MTIGEFVQSKVKEHHLEDLLIDHSSDYTYVRFNKIDASLVAMEFAKFLAEADLVGMRGNSDGSVSFWF